LRQPASRPLLDTWWQFYWATNLDLIQTVDLKSVENASENFANALPEGHLLVFRNASSKLR
jgi:hypothetical protein